MLSKTKSCVLALGVLVGSQTAAWAQFPLPPFMPPPPFPIPRVFIPPWATPFPVPPVVPPANVEVRITVPDPFTVLSKLQAELRRRAAAGEAAALTAGEALLLGLDGRLTIDGKTPRSFFGLEGTKRKLQVALVLDATDSMGRDIASLVYTLQAFVGLVRTFKADGDVSFALVLYRDTGAPSGVVTMPIGRFERNVFEVQRELAFVHTETGAPYFPERVDDGVYQAISSLDWDTSQDTTRWIMLCGDAPPFAEGSNMRRVRTSDLIAAANQRGINVNSILCTSGFVSPMLAGSSLRLFETAVAMRPEHQAFLSQLCSQTGGRFLDLSDPTVMHRLFAAVATLPAETSATPPASPVAPPPVTTPPSVVPGTPSPPAAPLPPGAEGELIAPGTPTTPPQ